MTMTEEALGELVVNQKENLRLSRERLKENE